MKTLTVYTINPLKRINTKRIFFVVHKLFEASKTNSVYPDQTAPVVANKCRYFLGISVSVLRINNVFASILR